MAIITIEIDIDGNGKVSVSPNPATVGNGDTVRWHVNSNVRGGGALVLRLPPSAGSPFGNRDNILETGVEKPQTCNLLDPSNPTLINWPPGVDSYTYDVDFSGSPVISSVTGTLLKRETIGIEYPEFPDDVREVFLVPANPPVGRGMKLKWYPKIHPLPWWKRCWYRYWPFKYHKNDCCCCCDKPAATPVVPPPRPSVVAPPTIVLSQGWLAIGGQFYLLITPQGSRCQFVVEWTATGGVGQLTVNLDVQDRGSTAFRRLASGLGPNDQYVFVGNRDTYMFRATVTDSRGQSTFDTLSVTCP